MYLLSSVATDAVLVQHQAISIHSAEQLGIAFNQWYRKYMPFIVNNIRK